jgi:hypothetical protein
MTVIQKYLIKYLAKIHGTVWFYNVISAWLGKYHFIYFIEDIIERLCHISDSIIIYQTYLYFTVITESNKNKDNHSYFLTF